MEPRDFGIVSRLGSLDRALRQVIAQHVFRVRATHRRVSIFVGRGFPCQALAIRALPIVPVASILEKER